MAFFTLTYLITSQFFKLPTWKWLLSHHAKKRFARLINSTTMSAFRSKLEGVDWSSVYSINSVNESYGTFSSLLTWAYSMSFPLQPAYSKPHRSSKPWFSNGLFTSCKRKNSLYKQFQLNPTALNKLRYNKYRNKYNFLIKLARKKILPWQTALCPFRFKKDMVSHKTDSLQKGTWATFQYHER